MKKRILLWTATIATIGVLGDFHPTVKLISSIIMLLISADVYVKNASRMGTIWRISDLVIGATIGALGTSSLELFTSLPAALDGRPAVSAIILTNLVGSNVTNVAFLVPIAIILGQGRMPLEYRKVATDLYVLAGVILLLCYIIHDLNFTRAEGALLFFLYLIYTDANLKFYVCRRLWRTLFNKTSKEINKSNDHKVKLLGNQDVAARYERYRKYLIYKLRRYFVYIVFSIVVMYFAGDIAQKSLIQIANLIDLRADQISQTLMSFLTSTAELFTLITSILLGKPYLGVGTIIGSNICNIGFVAGFTRLVGIGVSVPDTLFIGLPFVGVSTIILFFPDRDHLRLIHAFVLFGIYCGFLAATLMF